MVTLMDTYAHAKKYTEDFFFKDRMTNFIRNVPCL